MVRKLTITCLFAALCFATGCTPLEDKPIDDQKVNRTMEAIEKDQG